MLTPLTNHARWMTRLALDHLRPAQDASLDPATDLTDPIVLLHGFGGTPRMLRPLARFLQRKLGRPTLEIALGFGLGDIRDSAMRVHHELSERGVKRCDVVGYSLGGLVASYLVKCLDQGRCVRRVVTLGTPHRGVPFISHWPKPLVRCVRAADQMQIHSPFLDQLARLPLPAYTRVLSIAGSEDTLVPAASARLDEAGARNLLAQGVDHIQLITSRRVFRSAGRGLRSTLQPVRPLTMPTLRTGIAPFDRAPSHVGA